MRIGVVGATGALGREIVTALAEEALAPEWGGLEPPVLFASNRSAGETLPWVDDEDLEVEKFEPSAARGLDVAVLAVPESVAKEAAATLRGLGTSMVDASRAHRTSAPMFGAGRLSSGAGLVALPSAEALALGRVVAALGPLSPLEVRATVLKAASGAGQAGVTELAEATARLLNGQEPEAPKLPHRLAFNLVPQAGAFDGPLSEGEVDLAREVPLVAGRTVGVASTVAWGPWFYGHFIVASVKLGAAVVLDAARERLSGAPGLKVVDDPAQSVYPMPSLATGDEAVLVGRLRVDPLDPSVLSLVLAIDNVRASAVHAVSALKTVAAARRAS